MSGSYLLSVVHADTPYEVYTAVPMSSAGTVALQYTVPSSTNAVLNVTAVYGGSVLTLRPWYTTTTTYQPTTATTTICDKESDNYRYGYNGKLKDNEWAGIGNSYDYGARKFDSRIGRFITIDPLTKKYPWWTPYQYAGDNPIRYVDLDGLEPGDVTVHGVSYSNGGSRVKVVSSVVINIQVLNMSSSTEDNLNLGAVGDYVRTDLGSQMNGSHTGTIKTAYHYNSKNGKAEIGAIHDQSVTYQTSYIFNVKVIHSKDEISNNAIVVGVTDNIKASGDGDLLGVADDHYSMAFVKSSELADGKIGGRGHKIISHEIAHLFGASHSSSNNNPNNLMSNQGNGTSLSEDQIVTMEQEVVGDPGYLSNKKQQGKDLQNNGREKQSGTQRVNGMIDKHE